MGEISGTSSRLASATTKTIALGFLAWRLPTAIRNGARMAEQLANRHINRKTVGAWSRPMRRPLNETPATTVTRISMKRLTTAMKGKNARFLAKST